MALLRRKSVINWEYNSKKEFKENQESIYQYAVLMHGTGRAHAYYQANELMCGMQENA